MYINVLKADCFPHLEGRAKQTKGAPQIIPLMKGNTALKLHLNYKWHIC